MLVVPLKKTMVVEARHTVDAVGLSHAAGVGVGRGVVVDEKSVVVATRGLGDFKRPPAALARAFQWQHAVAKFERHLVSFYGPDTKLVHFAVLRVAFSYRARAMLRESRAAAIRRSPRLLLSLIHISEPTRQAEISYAVFCLK